MIILTSIHTTVPKRAAPEKLLTEELMKISTVLLSAGIIGAISIAALTTTAYAWHPKGVITKKVQNVTTSSALSEADTENQAVAAKPGDTLKYVIEVRNDGAADSKGYNDMAKTVMTDTLPSGIELVSNPSQRQITENLGLIKPGQKVTKEYLVKVTASKNGSIQNTACFTGDSTANDNPQKGCNPAVVKVTVPPKPEEPKTPVTPVTPETPKTPEMPAELPQTGAADSIILSTLGLGLMSYAAYRFIESRQKLSRS
jgi:uncharacterized repeat protein (TIGR01451 family)/LPXTG-motif cell wall-anchored protein